MVRNFFFFFISVVGIKIHGWRKEGKVGVVYSVILAYTNWGMASAMKIVRAFQLYIGEIVHDYGQTGRKQEGTSCFIRWGMVEKN